MEFLTEGLSSSPWTYAFVLSFAAFDALLPFFPSETAAIAAGVLAAAGDLNIFLVVAAAAGGAFLGDTSSYVVGRTAGNAAVDRLFGRRGGGLERLEWAGRVLETRGSYLIVVGRFVPGGRTAVTLTSGLTRMRLLRFVLAAAVAAVLWASFAGGLGYIGGTAFEDEPWRGLVAALGLAFFIVLLVELVRRLRRPRKRVCGTCTA
jgi:membrane-associated protein